MPLTDTDINIIDGQAPRRPGKDSASESQAERCGGRKLNVADNSGGSVFAGASNGVWGADYARAGLG
jgi:hypothetical protein